MSRHIRSGTWTLAELYDAAYLLDKTSTLTLESYKNVTYVKAVDPGIFFSEYEYPEIPCLTAENKKIISDILLKKYNNLVVERSLEELNGDIVCGVKSGESQVAYYPTFNIFQGKIENALLENAYKINTLYNTTKFEYDPISNYDRTETTTVEHNGTETDETIASNVSTKTGSESHTKGGEDSFAYSGETVTTPSGSTTTVHETTAFNEPTTYSGDSKDTTTYSAAKTTESFNNRKDTTTYNTDEQTVYNNVKDANDIDSTTTHSFNGRNEKTTSNIKGNIGVTTSQQMIQSEREVADFLWMDAVAKIITDAICIHTYYDPLDYYIEKEEGGLYEY